MDALDDVIRLLPFEWPEASDAACAAAAEVLGVDAHRLRTLTT